MVILRLDAFLVNTRGKEGDDVFPLPIIHHNHGLLLKPNLMDAASVARGPEMERPARLNVSDDLQHPVAVDHAPVTLLEPALGMDALTLFFRGAHDCLGYSSQVRPSSSRPARCLPTRTQSPC